MFENVLPANWTAIKRLLDTAASDCLHCPTTLPPLKLLIFGGCVNTEKKSLLTNLIREKGVVSEGDRVGSWQLSPLWGLAMSVGRSQHTTSILHFQEVAK